MTDGIRITQVNIVVRDIESTRRAWTRLLGEPLAQYNVPGPEIYRAELDGAPVDCSDVVSLKWAFGDLDIDALKAGQPLADDVFFLAFWQPGDNDTPWRRHLDTHGEGVMDLELAVPDVAAVADAVGTQPYHVGAFPDMVSALLATHPTLHVDLNVTART